MAGRIRDDDIEAVKERTDVVQLVGEYLTLKKTGHDSMSGLCPFHQEKTPSFSVSPAKQVFYCFGCGKGGDAITLPARARGPQLRRSGRAARVAGGRHLRYEGDSASQRRAAQRRSALIQANEEAAALFKALLADAPEAAEAREYLVARGIDRATAGSFEIGYAPRSRDHVLRELTKSRTLGPEILLEAGLASRGEDGVVRDRFRGRITIPIHDLQGRAIGFGARILPSDPRAGESAKYLNTAETPIYRKHEVLYNLHRARQQIARDGEVFVVEGYTDVIGLSQAGIVNTVATCGTALGEGHVRQLSRFAQRAILAFDSDEAGARAAERAFGFQEAFPSVQTVVMIMPDGLDPADFVAAHGADGVREAARTARPLVEYMLRRAISRHELGSVEGQAAAVAEVLPILERISDPVRRTEYAHLVADLTGVSEGSVRQALAATDRGRPADVVVESPKRMSARDRVEREMLKLIARDRALFAEYEARLTDDHIRSVSGRSALTSLRACDGDVGVVAGGDDRASSAPTYRRWPSRSSTATLTPTTPGRCGNDCMSSC